MYDMNLRLTIKTLHDKGKSKKEIARILRISVKTVRRVLKRETIRKSKSRSDKIKVDHDLLTALYQKCNGYLQRVHEILTEEYGIAIGYSTLTGLCRELSIGEKNTERSMQIPDIPGEEMQHVPVLMF
jgi:transposase